MDLSFMSRDVTELVRDWAEQQQDVLSITDRGLTRILPNSPVALTRCPSPSQPPTQLLGWVSASEALIF